MYNSKFQGKAINSQSDLLSNEFHSDRFMPANVKIESFGIV